MPRSDFRRFVDGTLVEALRSERILPIGKSTDESGVEDVGESDAGFTHLVEKREHRCNVSTGSEALQDDAVDVAIWTLARPRKAPQPVINAIEVADLRVGEDDGGIVYSIRRW